MSLSSAADSAVRARVPMGLSFRDVYQANYTYVWRSLLRLGVGDAAVDDAVQDTFIVVHRKLDAFEGRAAVRTWLFAIARRVALRYRDRARRNAVENDSDTEHATDVGRPDDALSRADTLRHLEFWLDELDDDKRAVFVLSEFEQLRAPEIAHALGVNLNTVYARLRAARQHVSRRARRDANLETYRPMLRLHSSKRTPTPLHRRHAWLVLSGKLGLGATVATASGTGLAAGGVLTKLAIAASLVGGGSMAAVVLSSPPTPSAAVASIGPGAQQLRNAQSVQAPAASDEQEIERPRLVRPQAQAVVPTLSPVPLAPTLQRHLDDRATTAQAKPGPAAQQPRTAAPAAAVPVPSADPFAAELQFFEQAKVASRAGRNGDALELLRRYRAEFPSGTFAVEAAALKVRTLCSDGRTDAARKAARSFRTRHAGSKLVNGDDPCG